MKKILICEDDKEIVALCKILLEKLGMTTVAYNSITDIFQIVEETKPDLILMDLWIPGIGGENAVKKLKLSDRHQHIPVILFSAVTNVEDIASTTKADGFIKKPFDINEFEGIIKHHLLLN